MARQMAEPRVGGESGDFDGERPSIKTSQTRREENVFNVQDRVMKIMSGITWSFQALSLLEPSKYEASTWGCEMRADQRL